jgi:hypothetical protein
MTVGINLKQLMSLIIEPTLNSLGILSESAVILLAGTAGVESGYGTYIKQIGKGPALGIYQMEPTTHADIWNNYLAFNKELAARIVRGCDLPNDVISEFRLISNLRYATAMTRMHYLRVKEPLPHQDDADAFAQYHKKYYNTYLGKTKTDDSKRYFEECIDVYNDLRSDK